SDGGAFADISRLQLGDDIVARNDPGEGRLREGVNAVDVGLGNQVNSVTLERRAVQVHFDAAERTLTKLRLKDSVGGRIELARCRIEVSGTVKEHRAADDGGQEVDHVDVNDRRGGSRTAAVLDRVRERIRSFVASVRC